MSKAMPAHVLMWWIAAHGQGTTILMAKAPTGYASYVCMRQAPHGLRRGQRHNALQSQLTQKLRQ